MAILTSQLRAVPSLQPYADPAFVQLVGGGVRGRVCVNVKGVCLYMHVFVSWCPNACSHPGCAVMCDSAASCQTAVRAPGAGHSPRGALSFVIQCSLAYFSAITVV